MASSPLSLWRRFLVLPNDTLSKTLGIALLVALVSATTVSVTSVVLKPRQDENVAIAREAKLAAMIAALPGLADILRETGAETLDTEIIDLETGDFLHDINMGSFDFITAQTDPDQSTVMSPEEDVAGIGRRPNQALVYLVMGTDDLELVILPVYGAGYQSTIRAYLALKGDLNTIAGISIYEQGETPGLGTRITDPAWLDTWSGKQIRNTSDEVVITVVRGSSNNINEVDGITGATRSTTGVANLVKFWMGEKGYGPFLKRLREAGN
jgi:Na+-transporting NADH:ubiquinone oxidoreductase subunit C